MAALNSFIGFCILSLNILDGYRVIKPARSSSSLDELGQSTSISSRTIRSSLDGTPVKQKDPRQRIGSSERRSRLRSHLTVLLVWVCWRRAEVILDQTFGWVIPFYETFKTVFLLWLLASRTTGSYQIFNNLIFPLVKPYEPILDHLAIQSSNFTSLVIFLISLPIARLTASLKNDLRPFLRGWISWMRDWSWSEQDSRISLKRKDGSSGSTGGNQNSPISKSNLNRTTKTMEVNASQSDTTKQFQPQVGGRKPSTLQSSSGSRAVSSGVFKPRVVSSNSKPLDERRSINSLTTSSAIAERLRGIPAPPTGVGPSSTAAHVPTSRTPDSSTVSGLKTFAFIPGQTPSREAALPVPSSLAGLVSPVPPGAFGSKLDSSYEFNSHDNSFSSRGGFMPTSRSPFRIFADSAASTSVSSASDQETSDVKDRGVKQAEGKGGEASSNGPRESTPKASKLLNGSNGKVLSSRSATLKGKSVIKGPSTRIAKAKEEESRKTQKKDSVKPSASTRKLRSSSVTSSQADEEQEVEEEDQEEAVSLTPRKRKAANSSQKITSPSTKKGRITKEAGTESQLQKAIGKIATTAAPRERESSGKIGGKTEGLTRASNPGGASNETEVSTRGTVRGRGTRRGTLRGRP